MDGFAERLLELIGEGRQRSAFARRTGVSETNIRKYLAGTTPGMDKVVQISQATGASIRWLATGEGARDAVSETFHLAQGAKEQDREEPMLSIVDPSALQDRGFVLLPRYDVQASAGHGIVVPGEDLRDFVGFEVGYLRATGIDPRQAQIIQVEGRSMVPTFVHGEWVIVDLSQTDVLSGEVYAVVYQEALRIKRLVREREAIVLTSDNKSDYYPDQRIAGSDLDDLRIVGRVRQHMRTIA